MVNAVAAVDLAHAVLPQVVPGPRAPPGPNYMPDGSWYSWW
jgi:hypothetical protein